MSTAVATRQESAGAIMEQVIAKGDLAKLTPDQRNDYYAQVCNSMGLNPLTRPFEYLTLNGKMVLYARRDCADQLRKINGISVEIMSRDVADGLITVHVRAKDKTGRVDEDFGIVSLGTLKGEAAANAVLKAVTKAKRRVTLSISGLGWLDETEVEDIPASAKAPAYTAPAIVPRQREEEEDPFSDPPANDTAKTTPHGRLMEQFREQIDSFPDTATLGAWWNGEERKRACKDFDLDQKAINELKQMVIERKAILEERAAA